MRHKVMLEVDPNDGMVYYNDIYIGTMTLTNIVEYIEPKSINYTEVTLALVKLGVKPEDIIQLKRNDLI